MARGAKTGLAKGKRFRGLFTEPLHSRRVSAGVAFFITFAVTCAYAEPTISLRDAAARRRPEYTLVNEGRNVVVSGQVSIHSVRIEDVYHLAIQEKGDGLVLEGTARILSPLSPGDHVEATGRLTQRSGLPVLVVSKVSKISAADPPAPIPLTPEAIQNLSRLGQLVVTEGEIVEAGGNYSGAYLRIGTPPNTLRVFLPGSADTRRSIAGFSIGDKVRVTGVAYQEAVAPPYLDQFELLVRNSKDIVALEGSRLAQIRSFWPILAALAAMGFFWWRREITSRQQRELLRAVYHLGEEILSASSTAEILSKITLVLPKLLNVTGARLYLHDRGTNGLSIVGEAHSTVISPDSPMGLEATSAVACFRNRIILAIPDTRRHPFENPPGEKPAPRPPRSILFVPMQAQGEPVGVLQLENGRRARTFNSDEQAVAQHLANQCGLAVKLLQQRSVREQLSRTEKLAAVGRLISGVVNDLQTPLQAISSMADSALEQNSGSIAPGHELLVIASEARRANAIVTRLVSFAQEQTPAEPVELTLLLRNLIQFREREWKACGIQLTNFVKRSKPVHVLGSQGQLEQVFLNLLVHAEQALEDETDKRIAIRADVLAKRVFIEIVYSAGETAASPADSESDLGLDVCKSVLAGHGGEMRITASSGQSKIEVELPCLSADELPLEPAPAEPSKPAGVWTALMLEPEEFVERRLVDWLSNRGYRVVPVRSSEEGLDLVQRMRFDVVFCSTRLTGLNWVEFFDRVRGRVGAFALLAEAFSQDLSTHFRGEGRFVLHKPIEQSQFDRTMAAIEGRLQSAEPRTPEVESY